MLRVNWKKFSFNRDLKKPCQHFLLKLIFATTTPVPANAKGRFEGDSIVYNKAALDVLANYPDIVINDLYSFTKPHSEGWAQEPGNVHYKDVGFLAQGKEVAKIIAEQL